MVCPNSTPSPSASIKSITLQVKDGIVITSDSDGMVKTWDVSTGIHKASFQTPAKDYKRDIQLIDERLILAYHTDQKIYVWDAGNEKLLLEVGGVHLCAEDLRISGDRSIIFDLCSPSIWAWSIQTGEDVGKVKIRYPGGTGSLIVYGSKVWTHYSQSEHEGWDFRISGSTPIHLSGMPALTLQWQYSLRPKTG